MSKRRWWGFAVVLVALAGACDGDDSDGADETLNCTLIGCDDGAHVVVHAPRDAWSAGDYTVEVSADKSSFKCTSKLPTASQSRFDNPKFACDGASPFLFLIRGDGCENGDSGIEDDVTCGTLELGVQGTPSKVRVRVDRSGTTVLDETWTPKYREFAPNGRECGPICKRSSTEWMLSD